MTAAKNETTSSIHVQWKSEAAADALRANSCRQFDDYPDNPWKLNKTGTDQGIFRMRKQARGNKEMGEIAQGNDRQKKCLRGNPSGRMNNPHQLYATNKVGNL